jgi:hypothetical protein
MAESIMDAWAALRAHLEGRKREAEWHERVRDFAAQLASAEDDGACDAARVLAALGAR